MPMATRLVDLRGTDFTSVASLVRRLSIDYVDRDFWIKTSPEELALLMDAIEVSLVLRSALIWHQMHL
ncbi:hypothetical protein GQ56_0102800 [Burkholderia paludis]|nr:hypothetical protein GQ56_0102800 [Burkholderia paludis]